MRKFLHGFLMVMFVCGLFLAGGQGMNVAEAKVYGTAVITDYVSLAPTEYEIRDNDLGGGGKYAIVNIKNPGQWTSFDYDGTWFTTYEYGEPDTKRKFIPEGFVQQWGIYLVDLNPAGTWTGVYYQRERADGSWAFCRDGNANGDSLAYWSNMMFWNVEVGNISLQ